jgi:hypothetical protein
MAAIETWACVTCGTKVSTSHCPDCGECAIRTRDLGFRQLFLISNLLFFAVQSITHDKVFSTPLDSHLHGRDWSELARDLVENRLAEKHLHETAA